MLLLCKFIFKRFIFLSMSLRVCVCYKIAFSHFQIYTQLWRVFSGVHTPLTVSWENQKIKIKTQVLTSCLEYLHRYARLAVLFHGNCQVWTARISKTLVYEIVYVCIWLNSKRPPADVSFYIARSIGTKHCVFKIIWKINIIYWFFIFVRCLYILYIDYIEYI